MSNWDPRMNPEAAALAWAGLEESAVEDHTLTHAKQSTASSADLTIFAGAIDDVQVDEVVASRRDTSVAAPRACFTTLVSASWTAR